MADAEKSLDILIRTRAELGGARAVEQQLERDIGKAKALGQNHDELSRKLAAVRGSIEEARAAHKDLADAEEEGAKSTEHLGLKKKELKKITRELAHEFPLAGMALRAFLNPVGVTATVAIGAFAAIKGKIDELNKSLDEMAASAAKPIGDMAGAIREAATEAATAAQGFNDKLGEMARSQQTLTDKTTAAVDAIRAQERAFVELTDAREAMALAMVDEQAKKHAADPSKGIDEVTAIRQRVVIKEAYDKQRRQVKDDADHLALTMQQDEMKRRNEAVGPLTDAASKSESAANDIKRKAYEKDLPNKLAFMKETLARQKTEFEKAQDEVDTLDAGRSRRDSPFGRFFISKEDREGADKLLSEAAAKKDELGDRMRATQRDIDKAQGKMVRAPAEQKKLDQEAADAVKARDENTAAIKSLDQTIRRMKEDQGLGHATREKLGEIHSMTRVIEAGGEVAAAEGKEDKAHKTRERAALLGQPGSVATIDPSGIAADILAPTNTVLKLLEMLVPGLSAQDRRLKKLEDDYKRVESGRRTPGNQR